MLEGSHFIGSLAGFGLLIVAWGSRAAWMRRTTWPCAASCRACFASLLKGGDYEEAIVMAALLAMLVPAPS